MKKWIILFVAASTLLVFTTGPALAGGFRIPESGAKAMGLGNAFVGQADDPSAVQFNPAGLTQLEGYRIMYGATSITTANDYKNGEAESSAEKGNYLVPFFYYTNHLEDLGDGNWWFGLSMTSPFGLGTEWDVSTFEYIATQTKLKMLKLNPVMAYKVSDRFSLGFGIDYYEVLEGSFQNAMAMTVGDLGGGWFKFDQKLKGDGTGFGFNVGGLYEVSEKVQLGFAYRTGVEVDLEGHLTLTGVTTPVPVEVKADGKATLNIPATAAVGVHYGISDAWKVNLDLDWTEWSAYDELPIKTDLGDSVVEKDYEDTITYRIGVDYMLNENWSLRGGFLMEEMPVPEETYDPRLPDGDRTGYSVGFGYEKDRLTVDFAYMLVLLDKTSISNDIDQNPSYNIAPTLVGDPAQTVDGDYEGDITLIGFSVGFAF